MCVVAVVHTYEHIFIEAYSLALTCVRASLCVCALYATKHTCGGRRRRRRPHKYGDIAAVCTPGVTSSIHNIHKPLAAGKCSRSLAANARAEKYPTPCWRSALRFCEFVYRIQHFGRFVAATIREALSVTEDIARTRGVVVVRRRCDRYVRCCLVELRSLTLTK